MGPGPTPGNLMSLPLERALRWAAARHEGQCRKGSKTPYVQHVVGVALILDRLGFSEEVVIAGLLHDIVEDTETSIAEVEVAFGAEVARTVRACSEVKNDETGHRRPWINRKRDHLAELEKAPASARAVALADKLHNLTSMRLDLQEGRPVWSLFNAGRDDVLWYYRSALERYVGGDDRLDRLASECRMILETLGSTPPG
ncbi:HD domain-containing protein [Singulisphaera sp. PoT]|uniref:HD domain-containing protein n=1 Tax=Singulisphaera sp. PoT TaxID=3411797 RepID=UPI003BF52B1B